MTKYYKIILEVGLADWGIDHSSYFPGFGTVLTEWTHAYTGAGDNPWEAVDDAFEQWACSMDMPDDYPWDAVRDRVLRDTYGTCKESELQAPSAYGHFAEACEEEGLNPENEECDTYYFVTVLVRVDEEIA